MGNRLLVDTLFIACFFAMAPAITPQQPARSELIRQAIRLDNEGKYAEARQLLQQAIDTAADPAAKAAAQRALAMSWAFAGNCTETVKYEQMVIDYWKTREQQEPANAFFQQGEMATEAARVCIDAGDMDAAERWYRKGRELGMKEPSISADRKALWDFRLEHALARLAARRGDRAEADRHVRVARAALDRMTDLRKQQEIFFPYLTGYVAFYLGDHKKALEDLLKANQRDPFIQTFTAQVYEKLGDKQKAAEYYSQAAASAGHNPPAAYAHRFAKKALLAN